MDPHRDALARHLGVAREQIEARGEWEPGVHVLTAALTEEERNDPCFCVQKSRYLALTAEERAQGPLDAGRGVALAAYSLLV